MAAEFTAIAEQTVNPGESITFDTTQIPCRKGYIRHRNSTGLFLADGGQRVNTCCCCNNEATENYVVSFGANIAIPAGGTVGEISIAGVIEGTTLPGTTRSVTPAAVSEYGAVSFTTIAPVWSGCCESISVRNTSNQPILVKNANIIFSR